jgi:hypothetical protein
VVLADVASYSLTNDRFEMTFDGATVVFWLAEPAGAIAFRCSKCLANPESVCRHAAAAMSLILEEKVALGLAAPPIDKALPEKTSQETLLERAISERREMAQAENLTVIRQPPKGVWGEYQVENPKSGRSYRVSLRGWEKGKSFCECPDFKVNALGLCKHTLTVERFLEKKGKNLRRIPPYSPLEVEVHLDYSVKPPALRLQPPANLNKGLASLLAPFVDKPVTDVRPLVQSLKLLEELGEEPLVFPDALEWIELSLLKLEVDSIAQEIQLDPLNHPLRATLLKEELAPYQLAAIAFAAEATRSILAFDLGLGRLETGLGLATFLAKLTGLGKVLIICPSRLKSQWRDKIHRLTDKSVSVVKGEGHLRRESLAGKTFFTVWAHEAIEIDRTIAKLTDWDLIILDEAPRYELFKGQSLGALSELKSQRFLALTSAPRENNLDELKALVKLVDPKYLEVFNKDLELGPPSLKRVLTALSPIYLRKTRGQVLKELPARVLKVIPVEASLEQMEIHNRHIRLVTRILKKPVLTDIDILRLTKYTQNARLAAVSAALVERRSTAKSGKFLIFESFLEKLLAESGRRILIVSKWPKALDLAEDSLLELKAPFERVSSEDLSNGGQMALAFNRPGSDNQIILAVRDEVSQLKALKPDTVIHLDLASRAEMALTPGEDLSLGDPPLRIFILGSLGTIEEKLWRLDPLTSQELTILDLERDPEPATLARDTSNLRRQWETLWGHKERLSEGLKDPLGDNERRDKMALAVDKLVKAGSELIAALTEEEPLPGEGWESSPLAIAPRLLARFTETDSLGQSRLVIPTGELKGLIVEALDNISQYLRRKPNN